MKRQKESRGLVGLALGFGLALLLSACGGGAGTPKVRAAMLGKVVGVLADNVDNAFVPDADPAASTDPIVIGGVVWNDSFIVSIKNAFDAGRPIALVHASLDDIGMLRKVVGFPGDFVLPDGLTQVDIYGVDRDIDGNIYDVVIFPNPDLPAATEVKYALDPVAQTSTPVASRSVPVDNPDDEQKQQQRVNDLAAWFKEDAPRDVKARQAAAHPRAALAASLGGYDLAANAKSFARTYVFSHGNNRHQVTNRVWSAHDDVNNEDIFYIRQTGLFAAAAEVIYDTGYRRGMYATAYKVANYVPDLLNNNSQLQLLMNNPATHEGKVSVDVGVDLKLDGKFGVDAKADGKGPSAGGELGVSGGIAIKNSIKYDIPDVTVTNKSGMRINDANWDFTIRKPGYVWNPLCRWFSLQDIPPLGKGTFQPATEWVWRVGKEARQKYPADLPIQTDFYAEIGETSLGFLEFTLCEAFRREGSTGRLGAQMTAPWPPVVAIP